MLKAIRHTVVSALVLLPGLLIAGERFDGNWATRLLKLDRAIKQDGSAKLSANGVVVSREYARGIFAHKGEEYSYNVKAKFQDSQGTGTRDAGLGIVARTCTFDFVKQ